MSEVRFIFKGLSESSEPTKERINYILLYSHIRQDNATFIAPSESSFRDFIEQLPYSVKVERQEV